MPVLVTRVLSPDHRPQFVALRHLLDWQHVFEQDNVIATCTSLAAARCAIEHDVATRLESAARIAAAILWVVKHPTVVFGLKPDESNAVALGEKLIAELWDMRSLCAPFGTALVLETPSPRGGIMLDIDGQKVNPSDWEQTRLVLRRRYLEAEAGVTIGGAS